MKSLRLVLCVWVSINISSVNLCKSYDLKRTLFCLSFCTQLTSITQGMVDQGQTFPQALEKFLGWIASYGQDYVLCSWGFYDKTQFESDCRYHELATGWLSPHISLKHQYAEIHGIKPCGMKAALRREKMSLEGTHHRGIDDARNITKLFLAHFDKWSY